MSLGEFVDVLFVRHATPEYPFEQFPDPFSMPLSSVGRKEAEGVATAVARFSPQVVFASDFRRAIETAQIALGGTHIELRVSQELRERTFYSLVGMNFSDIIRTQGESARPILEGNSDEVNLPGEEPYETAKSRVVNFIKGFHPTRDGQRVMVFSHGGPHAWLVSATGVTSLRGVRTGGIGMGRCSLFRVDHSGIRVIAKNVSPEEVPTA